MRYKGIIIFIPLLVQSILAQNFTNPLQIPDYPFIHNELNCFEQPGGNLQQNGLFLKFDSLIRFGIGKISVVHIGGSHVQADVYTHQMRCNLQTFYPGVLGSRGFFFPSALARTNSPSNLLTGFTGRWKTIKNTQPDSVHPLGLSGMTAILTSNSGCLTVVARFDSVHHYDFNRVRIYCNAFTNGIVPDIILPEPLQKKISIKPQFVEYLISDYLDTLRIRISQTDTITAPFELYGISLENDDPGVSYHSIGVNGAKLDSYLLCELFSPQLRSLNPDWVILSIGTNDGNTRHFDAQAYRNSYLRLLDSVRIAVPSATILLTVPNDSYLFKRYTNHNTARMRGIIFEIARIKHCSVWDFYSVMGGLNSAHIWFDKGLMSPDHIHFNRAGYLLKGKLFFQAFLNTWSGHLDSGEFRNQLHCIHD